MGKTHTEIIHQSHKRSKEFGLTKGGASAKRFLSESQVKRLLKENAELLEITSPIVESLYDFLKGSGFIIILTDKTGRILEIEGDIETLDETSRQNLVPGALMAEKSVGTNAVGTALSEDSPIQVTASEHFINIFQHVRCV